MAEIYQLNRHPEREKHFASVSNMVMQSTELNLDCNCEICQHDWKQYLASLYTDLAALANKTDPASANAREDLMNQIIRIKQIRGI